MSINKLKKIVLKFDNRFLNRRIQKIYNTVVIKRRRTEYLHGGKSRIVEIPLYDMLLMQLDHHEMEFLNEMGYDFAVRLLAIEEYYDKNSIGFSLYKKMHTLNGNYGDVNQSEMYYAKMQKKGRTATFAKKREEHSIEQFVSLIKSIEKKGFNTDSIVMADRNLVSMNGSHRLSICYYFGKDIIKTEITKELISRTYTRWWFWANGFTRAEMKQIDWKMKEIHDECIKRIGCFYFILYSPAYRFFDEITEDISLIDPDNVSVESVMNYNLDEPYFVGLIRLLYSFDSITKKNLERKIAYILKSSENRDTGLPIRVLKVKILNPQYRLKYDNGMPESMVTVRIKDSIRRRYKKLDTRLSPEYKKDYHHDVIIHSTDNYLSNNACRIVFSLCRNISVFFESIKRYSYAVIESSYDKIGNSFPYDYQLNDDIDLFVEEKKVCEISEILYIEAKKIYNGEWISVEKYKVEHGYRVRVLLRNQLVLMFDLITELSGVKDFYISRCLKDTVEKNGVKYLTVKNEVTVRLAKYLENKSKLWHADYIRSKREYTPYFDCFYKVEQAKKNYERIINIK